MHLEQSDLNSEKNIMILPMLWYLLEYVENTFFIFLLNTFI